MMDFQSEPVSTTLTFALIPVSKVLIMCGLGFLLATQRIGILSPTGIKLLSKLVFMVFLPCLIFTQLGAAITFQKMLQWWFIPVNVVLASVIGCSIGCIVVLIVRPPPKFKKFTVVMVGIGNIGNIPLVLIDALCRDASNPFGDYDTCSEEGVAYISFGQWVGAVIVYTFVFHMLSPSEASDCGDQRFDIEDHSSLTVNLMNAEEDEGGDGSSTKKTSWWTMKVTLAVKAVKVLRLKEIFQPPVAASILALIVGAIPFLKNLLLTDDAPLYFFSNSLSILGGAMIPCIMLALGGNLVGGPGSSNLGLRTTIAITFTRLFIIPPMGIGVVFLAKKLDFIPADNQLFQFVLLLQHSMPTSILAGGVAALRGVAVKEASAILFWEHIVAIVSISIWLIVYLNFLF